MLILKRFYVFIELILERLEFIFKFLEVTIERGHHVVEVVHDSIDLNFHVGTQRLLKRFFHVSQHRWHIKLANLNSQAIILNFVDLFRK